VASLKELYSWTKHLVKKEGMNDKPNGMFFLKGGDLKVEIAELNRGVEVQELNRFFSEEYFETKKVVYLPL
jgi:16S rRNA (guanine527-N7)-methyltransferase